MEAFVFAFGLMKESELDGLRKMTLSNKAFYIFSFQDWKNQLQLIDRSCNGHQNMVSELLKLGAPDEINPLFIFRIMGIAPHPRAASWPLRILLEIFILSGLNPGQQKEYILQYQRLLR